MSLLAVTEDGRSFTARRGSIGKRHGWCFEMVNPGRKYPQIISALYRSKLEAEDAIQDYLETGKLDSYGSAE